jgi:predicted transcriptional regulator with HTH domain
MKLSKEKKDKIAEQILSHLYHSFPKQLFTAEIAKEIARDEEFIKTLMFELKEKNLVIIIKKNEDGKDFVRRIRWQLSGPAYQAYDVKAKENPVVQSDSEDENL